jgi:hypothetical protein
MSISPVCANAIAKVKRNAVRLGGVNGIRALSRALGITADDSEDVVKCAAFVASLTAHGIHLSDAEQAALWKWLDRTAEGIICPAEFVAALRHIDSPLRRSMVTRVLGTFDRDGQGNIKINDIQQRYRAERHPQVLRGEASVEDAEKHLFESFNSEGNPSGKVSSAEVQQYFAGLSAVVDTDDRFCAILRGCWCLPHFNASVTQDLSMAPDSDTGLSCQLGVEEKTRVLLRATVRKAVTDTFAAHTKQLIGHAAGFRAVGLSLRRADPESTGFVDRDLFFEALAQARLYAERPEVLDVLDVNRDGTFDYLWYLHAIVGELPPARRLAAERLWNRVPTDAEDYAELAWLHKNFVTHSADNLSVFFDSWDQRKATGSKNGGKPRISAFEFINEWLIPMSHTIQKDADFAKALAATFPASLNGQQ